MDLILDLFFGCIKSKKGNHSKAHYWGLPIASWRNVIKLAVSIAQDRLEISPHRENGALSSLSALANLLCASFIVPQQFVCEGRCPQHPRVQFN